MQEQYVDPKVVAEIYRVFGLNSQHGGPSKLSIPQIKRQVGEQIIDEIIYLNGEGLLKVEGTRHDQTNLNSPKLKLKEEEIEVARDISGKMSFQEWNDLDKESLPDYLTEPDIDYPRNPEDLFEDGLDNEAIDLVLSRFSGDGRAREGEIRRALESAGDYNHVFYLSVLEGNGLIEQHERGGYRLVGLEEQEMLSDRYEKLQMYCDELAREISVEGEEWFFENR